MSIVDIVLNGLSFSVLLTALYILRFRGWTRPWAVVAYFIFFATIEIVASRYWLPADAFGPLLSYVCFFLTVPVLIAAYLVYRYEQRHGAPSDVAVIVDARSDERE